MACMETFDYVAMICKNARRPDRHCLWSPVIWRWDTSCVPGTAQTERRPPAHPPRRNPGRGVAAAVLATVVGGCGSGGGGSGDPCTASAQKQWVLDTTRDWYFFDDLLPAPVDAAQFQTAVELLDHLTSTARAENKDRFFSFLTTRAEDDSLLGEGQFTGFGFRTRTDSGPRVFVVEVFEGSPASEGGLARGDEIVAVDSGNGYVTVADLLASGDTISDVLGPAEPGVRRGLRLTDASTTRDVSLVKRTVTIDPVPDDGGVRVLPLAAAPGVGYVNLRTYISTAEGQLRTAFDGFRTQGIQYFIVDVRYNGGGLVRTSELLGDLLGGARSSSDVMSRTLFNSRHTSANLTRPFRPQSQSVAPVRIAFLTTEATASASELNVNTIQPWVEVAIVGGDTFGKPVGQGAFDLAGCEDRLRLVTFKTVNALDEGDYFDGLAPTLSFACAANDTLTAPQGDPAEDLTAAALEWLQTGACGTVIDPASRRFKPGAGPDAGTRFPRPRHPSAAQAWMPGVQ
jgi:carboxyl-terminal processing protease